MNLIGFHTIVFLILLNMSLADPIQDQFARGINPNVQKAHESFLRGDLKIMAINVRDLLRANNASTYERKNVLSLISRAQNLIGDGSIPTDWKIPIGIKDLVLSIQTIVDPNGTSHQLIMEGFSHSDLGLKGLQIIDTENRIILNSKDPDSQWGRMVLKDNDWSKFNVRTELNSILDEGLYFFNIQLASELFEGWFIYTEAKTKSRREYSKQVATASLFQLSSAEGFSKGILEHKIIIKPGSKETQENEYKVMRDAANQKILVMKRREEFATKDFLNMKQQDQSPNVLRMNHNTTQNFGDLTIRRLIATEVLIDK